MIDFRYHVVSIVAVFLALTVGLVLGASFLKGEQVSLLTSRITDATNAKNSLQNQNRSLTTTTKHLNDYIDETKDNLVSNQLYNDYVVVVRTAGDDETSTDAVLALAKQASATITADVTVNTAFTDSGSAERLNELMSDYAPTGQSLAGGDTVTKALNLLTEALTAQATSTAAGSGTGSTAGASATASASATSTPPVSTAPATMTAEWSVKTLDAFKAIGVIAVTTMPAAATMTKPTAAFISAPTASAPDAQNQAYVTLAQSLHAAGVGPVVGGPAAAAGSGGLITELLKSTAAAKTISSVNDMDQTIGQVAVVFVLYQESANPAVGAGHYGTTGSTDGVMPKLPSLTPPTPSSSS